MQTVTTIPSYMHEAWFILLQNICKTRNQHITAEQLKVSQPTLSQILNGKGKYGNGTANTRRFAQKVVLTFGEYPCPHLTEMACGEVQLISSDKCRELAHKHPGHTPLAIQQWQACQGCKYKDLTAPALADRARGPKNKTPGGGNG